MSLKSACVCSLLCSVLPQDDVHNISGFLDRSRWWALYFRPPPHRRVVGPDYRRVCDAYTYMVVIDLFRAALEGVTALRPHALQDEVEYGDDDVVA